VPLTAWESFYVIVGSSAGALTGLQFVVIALIAQSQTRASSGEIAAFGSPTVLHFCAALLVSATLSAPWRSLRGVGITLIACGLAGAIYSIVVARRARQTGYKAVFEDWLWHVVLPFAAYLTLIVAGVMLPYVAVPFLFSIGAATLLLVFIGIHNAWDAVVYVTVNQLRPSGENRDRP